MRSEEKVGILGYSERFSELIYDACKMYAEDIDLTRPLIVGSDANIQQYISDKDSILVPKNYEKYFDSRTLKYILESKSNVIDCNYEIDDGSVLYLETKIKKIRDKKNL